MKCGQSDATDFQVLQQSVGSIEQVFKMIGSLFNFSWPAYGGGHCLLFSNCLAAVV